MKKVIVAIMILASHSVYAQTHDHHAPKHQKSKVESQSSKKFIPTPDLKVRMDKIFAISNELSAKKNDQKRVRADGEKLLNIVGDIFKTCKLEPEADDAVHPVLAKILEAAEDLKNGNLKSGQIKINESLSVYKKSFSQ